MKSYNVVIVDDEVNNILLLKHFITQYCPDVTVVGEALTSIDAISVINDYSPDILLLDIRLNGKEVFEVLDQIKINKAQIIFVTSHDEYALRAIKYNAIDYILKPIIIDELVLSISKAITKLQQQNYFDFSKGTQINSIKKENSNNKDYIAIASMDKIELIKISDIIYISSHSKYATFHIINGKEYVSNKNLIYYENILDNACFFRIHKSYIISIKHTLRIIKKDGAYCELVNGIFLPISKRKQDLFNRFIKIKD